MSRSKRVLWVLAAAFCAMLAPRAAWSVEQDPYILRTLLGRLYFEYETSSRNESGARTETNRFRQTYSLDMKGNILSRRLIIYDAGISFTTEDVNVDSSETQSDLLSYYLSTTLLPLSSTPLTLYGSRSETENESSTTTSSTTTTNYGMNILLRMRRLPKASFSADRTDREGTTTDESVIKYRLTMDHDIGPTENSIRLDRQEDHDHTDVGEDSFTNTLNFMNRTLVSKDTSFTLGFVASNTETGDTESRLSALNMTLISRPSQDFEQNHSFTTYSNETDSTKLTGRLYDGTLMYDFNERLSSHLSLSMNNTKNRAETSATDSDSIAMDLGINYKFSSNTTITQTVIYSETDTRSTDPAATTADYLLMKEVTTIIHTRDLKRANLNASMGVGLLREESSERRGTGIEENATLSLSNIDVNKYVGFDAYAANSYVQQLEGEISGSSTEYSLAAFNKFWRRHTQMSASYKKTSQESWINRFNEKRESLRFDLTGQYFSRLNVAFYVERASVFNEASGYAYVTTGSASGYFNQHVWGGNFSSGLSFSTSVSEYPGGSQRLNFSRVFMNYNKFLARRALWSASLEANEQAELTTDVFTRTARIENALLFPVRQWLMSVEHTYSLIDSSSQDVEENKFLFKLTRSFLRLF